jgi:site-specific DNA-methyltransferase (adenine-specific)
MQELSDDSIDLIVTDPPYGLTNLNPEKLISNEEVKGKGFMGKEWDNIPPTSVWEECLRVLKPGAFAFIMCAPRQDCQLVMQYRLMKAGFQINFSPLYHCFASGFPKSMSISKAVDKRLGAEREVVKKVEPFGRENRKASMGGFGNSDIDYADGYLDDNLREVTKAATPQAKALDGSYAGAQFKPAVEVILVAMKPLSEKTYVEQAMKNGKGITWLDNCRIPYKSESDKISCDFTHTKKTSNPANDYGNFAIREGIQFANAQGRFPANLLVSDDVLNDGKEIKAHYVKEGGFNQYGGGGFGGGVCTPTNTYADSGSFSRYFSLDAWWDKKVKELPKSVQKTFPFLITPKASKSEKNKGLENLEEKDCRFIGSHGGSGEPIGTSEKYPDGSPRPINKMKNNHPTCKPIKLMSYLITLGSRQGDTVLDPFLGSGTTAIACETLCRNYIGIELNEEYIIIAEARLKPYQTQGRLFND